jgi:hypothetical protein
MRDLPPGIEISYESQKTSPELRMAFIRLECFPEIIALLYLLLHLKGLPAEISSMILEHSVDIGRDNQSPAFFGILIRFRDFHPLYYEAIKFFRRVNWFTVNAITSQNCQNIFDHAIRIPTKLAIE